MKICMSGTFDLFHVGHLHAIEQAKRLGDYLIVAVSADARTHSIKGRKPLICESVNTCG